jgi:2Fe-2S ferredoxin
MPVVVYVQPDGTEYPIEVPVGDTVMDGALDNGVPGILGQCGGGCTCSTCHCFVADSWLARVPPATADELDLLEYLPTRLASSRLSCQIVLTDTLDGLRVVLPREQV